MVAEQAAFIKPSKMQKYKNLFTVPPPPKELPPMPAGYILTQSQIHLINENQETICTLDRTGFEIWLEDIDDELKWPDEYGHGYIQATLSDFWAIDYPTENRLLALDRFARLQDEPENGTQESEDMDRWAERQAELENALWERNF